MENDIFLRVIGFGPETAGAIHHITEMNYDGLDAAMAGECPPVPADNNRIAVILASGNSDAAEATIRRFRRRGIFTILISTHTTDTQADAAATIPVDEFARTVKILADPMFKAGHINIDFNDLYQILRRGSTLHLIQVTGCSIDDPVAQAVDELKCKVDHDTMQQIKALVLNLYYNPATSFKASQARAISRFITLLNPETEVVWGLSFDDALPTGAVRITLIACS